MVKQLISVCLVASAVANSVAQVGSIFRVTAPVLTPAGGGGAYPAISADGRFVAFLSGSDAYVPNDTNLTDDVFVHDRLTGAVVRASLSSIGQQSSVQSFEPAISGNGRFVAFRSAASDLVPGDTNGATDVFVRDLQLGTTTRVSVASGGVQLNSYSYFPSISGNGRYIAFISRASNFGYGNPGREEIYVHDRDTNLTVPVSWTQAGVFANANCGGPSISADGAFVTFNTVADNLGLGDINGRADVILRNMATGQLELISVASAGVQGNDTSWGGRLSADGRYVAFGSVASNLVLDDTNGEDDVFVRDTLLDTTVRVSVGTGGIQGNSDSPDVDISADGRFVLFSSSASNFVVPDTNNAPDVFLRDLLLGTTVRVSERTGGGQGNGGSFRCFISGDARFACFQSHASNFVPGDDVTNDIFTVDTAAELSLVANLVVNRGAVVGGSVSSLQALDNDRLVMRPGPVFSTSMAPIQITVDSTTGVFNPSRLELYCDIASTSSNIHTTIELFNYVTQEFESIETKPTSTTEKLIVTTVVQDVGRFVGKSGEVQARVSYKAIGPVFSYPWEVRINRIMWSLAP